MAVEISYRVCLARKLTPGKILTHIAECSTQDGRGLPLPTGKQPLCGGCAIGELKPLDHKPIDATCPHCTRLYRGLLGWPTLRGHLWDGHRPEVGKPPASLADQVEIHAELHAHGMADHEHGPGPNLGPGRRPRGWYDGTAPIGEPNRKRKITVKNYEEWRERVVPGARIEILEYAQWPSWTGQIRVITGTTPDVILYEQSGRRGQVAWPTRQWLRLLGEDSYEISPGLRFRFLEPVEADPVEAYAYGGEIFCPAHARGCLLDLLGPGFAHMPTGELVEARIRQGMEHGDSTDRAVYLDSAKMPVPFDGALHEGCRMSNGYEPGQCNELCPACLDPVSPCPNKLSRIWYLSLFFDQGDEADRLLRILYRKEPDDDSVVWQGVTSEGITDVLAELADCEGDGVYMPAPDRAGDHYEWVVRNGTGYLLSWDLGHGHIGLDTAVAADGWREKFTDEEWQVFLSGRCCWTTEYGTVNGVRHCMLKPHPESDMRYCPDHHNEEMADVALNPASSQ